MLDSADQPVAGCSVPQKLPHRERRGGAISVDSEKFFNGVNFVHHLSSGVHGTSNRGSSSRTEIALLHLLIA